ncbi:alpha/beta hydrolase [Neisseriaceae bacterium JH1-16]|nr:alpha/beta hydrolase [Neisseriaceae bacterium JH1-16]
MKSSVKYLGALLATAVVAGGSAAAFAPVTAYAWWTELLVRASGFAPKTLALPDGRLSYRQAGRGPAVMLIHGFGANGTISWRAQMTKLVKTHRVIVPDLLWFGDSQSQRAPSLSAQTDALQVLIEHLGIADVALVGVSYGGFVAMELAHRLSQRISSMVIINSPGTVYRQSDLDSLLVRAEVSSAEALFIPEQPTDIARLLRMTLAEQPLFPIPTSVLEEMRNQYYVGREEALRRLMRDLIDGREHYQARMHGVTWPRTELIWSDSDQIFPLPIGRRLAEAIGAPMRVVPGAGHNLPVEKPKETTALLSSILKPQTS